MKKGLIVSCIWAASSWAQGFIPGPNAQNMTPFPQPGGPGVLGPGQMFPGQMNPMMPAVGEQPAMSVAGAFDCVVDRNGQTRLIPRGGAAIQAPVGHQ
jgi:hypothetical protein